MPFTFVRANVMGSSTAARSATVSNELKSESVDDDSYGITYSNIHVSIAEKKTPSFSISTTSGARKSETSAR